MNVNTDENIFGRIFGVNSNFIIDVWCGEHMMATHNMEVRDRLRQILNERDLDLRHLLAAKFAGYDDDYQKLCRWIRPPYQFTPG